MAFPDTLADLADTLLTAAAAGLDTTRTGHPNFTRQFRSHNAPAWEICAEAQLTVHTASLRHRQPVTKAPCQVVPEIELHVQFVRCLTSDVEGPPAATLDTEAEGLLVDLWALLNYLYQNPVVGDCEFITYGQVIPLGPSGGVGGYDVAVVLGVNGAI